MPSVFSQIDLDPGHLDRMRDATCDILRANEKLKQWCEGRIFGVELLAVPATIQAPCILVAALSESPIFGVGCAEVTAPIGSVFFWRQPTQLIGDGEPSFAALVDEWRRTIVGNYYLSVPRFDLKRMTKRLHSIKQVDFETLRPDPNTAAISVVLSAEYLLDVDPQTWRPRGW